MQQYKRPEAIKRMNELAGSRKPFLFIIDYKQQCSLIEEISRIDSTRCRYNFNGVKNVDTVLKNGSSPHCLKSCRHNNPLCPYKIHAHNFPLLQ